MLSTAAYSPGLILSVLSTHATSWRVRGICALWADVCVHFVHNSTTYYSACACIGVDYVFDFPYTWCCLMRVEGACKQNTICNPQCSVELSWRFVEVDRNSFCPRLLAVLSHCRSKLFFVEKNSACPLYALFAVSLTVICVLPRFCLEDCFLNQTEPNRSTRNSTTEQYAILNGNSKQYTAVKPHTRTQSNILTATKRQHTATQASSKQQPAKKLAKKPANNKQIERQTNRQTLTNRHQTQTTTQTSKQTNKHTRFAS